MTRNLPIFAGIFSVSMNGLIIVTVALMKESLLKVTCATSEESGVRFNLTALMKVLKKKELPVLVLISHLRKFNSLVHQNTTASEYVASLT